ncbi:helix-turn-helix domain-containing protein [Armatimonas sp.]|uniref:helix-turn-helix domain-containing protein n=1 Tax=Armatimonas sp. TaxID=1872638 RepID=UPI00286D4745|nr:helix-turn-helix domain-containing protein [Armatimonas sp.]
METIEGVEYLTVQEVAAKCSITPAAVRKAVAEGRLPSRRLASLTLIPKSGVDSWKPAGHGGKRPGQGRKKQDTEEETT